jgi:hypothetical protein
MLNLFLLSWALATVVCLVVFGFIDAAATARASGLGSPTNWWLVLLGSGVVGIILAFVITGGTAIVQSL